MNKDYLGDGIHASDDGFHVILEADNESGRPARIYLDGTALSALFRYVERVRGLAIQVRRLESQAEEDA